MTTTHSPFFHADTNTFEVKGYAEPWFGVQQPGGPWILNNIHPEDKCLGGHCTIHNPSDHHMIDWPLNWRGDRRMLERICPHGTGHPDPDTVGDSAHGCDGCCSSPAESGASEPQ